jgi:hypothetical protein
LPVLKERFLRMSKFVSYGCALSVWLVSAAGVSLSAQAAATQQAPPAAEQKPAALPEARTIIDRHIAAVGGRATLESYTSSHVRGRFAMPATGLSGPVEIFAAAPNKTLMRMTMTGIGDLEEGFDGTVGWMLSAVTGPMLTEGTELEQKKFDSDFFGDLKASSRYKTIETVERTTFDDRDVYKVRLVATTGVEDIEFYEVESGLKAGAQMTRETPMGPMSSTVTFSDYRTFGKLRHPATQTFSTMGMEHIVTIESVEYNSVDPKVFALPEPIKALIK